MTSRVSLCLHLEWKSLSLISNYGLKGCTHADKISETGKEHLRILEYLPNAPTFIVQEHSLLMSVQGHPEPVLT